MKNTNLICPFCNGTKTKPFAKTFKSQHCEECDNDGNITVSKLKQYGLL